MNERITENIVRDSLRSLGYYDDDVISIEEQKSKNPVLQQCLRRASKTGGSGCGKPEFIIKSKENNSFVIVIECKADIKKHQSKSLDKYTEFAVDGVLLYSAFLSVEYNVISIAISGQDKEKLKVSTFLQAKGAHEAKPFVDKYENLITRILSFEEFISTAVYDKNVEKSQYLDLLKFSQELHEYIRDYAKLGEAEKPLLVSGILIALSSNHFRRGYSSASSNALPNFLFDTIKQEIEEADIPKVKKQNITQPYTFITAYPSLREINADTKENPLARIIGDIDKNVYPFVNFYQNFDVVGQFYAEFLRYAGGDSSLGIVLTPKHITELFVEIANLNTKSIVLDSCAGTAGFLVSSMINMCQKAVSSEEIKNIKDNGLIGIESQPKMFALAASNMILRGDGKANLFQGSCFEQSIIREIKSLKPNIGMINPPYSQKGQNLHELNFVLNMLEFLQEKGTGIAIVPISCAIESHPLKEALLEKHTLVAVMTMPDDLFHSIGVYPCIMVWNAKIPHRSNPHLKTWFGHWKNDGFLKIKNKGRIDANSKWQSIKEKWLSAYHNRQEIPGFSVLKRVESSDEWCAEAYMETDYSDIKRSDISLEVKKYIAFQLINSL